MERGRENGRTEEEGVWRVRTEDKGREGERDGTWVRKGDEIHVPI